MVQKDFLKFLQAAKKMKSGEMSNILDFLSDNTIDDICECVFNVINTDLRLSRGKKNRLRAHIKKNCNLKRIKCLTNKKIPIFKRRKALKMEGRGLPLILASVIPILTSLFTRKRHQ